MRFLGGVYRKPIYKMKITQNWGGGGIGQFAGLQGAL